MVALCSDECMCVHALFALLFFPRISPRSRRALSIWVISWCCPRALRNLLTPPSFHLDTQKVPTSPLLFKGGGALPNCNKGGARRGRILSRIILRLLLLLLRRPYNPSSWTRIECAFFTYLRARNLAAPKRLLNMETLTFWAFELNREHVTDSKVVNSRANSLLSRKRQS